jgi:hypothetical protein
VEEEEEEEEKEKEVACLTDRKVTSSALQPHLRPTFFVSRRSLSSPLLTCKVLS